MGAAAWNLEERRSWRVAAVCKTVPYGVSGFESLLFHQIREDLSCGGVLARPEGTVGIKPERERESGRGSL